MKSNFRGQAELPHVKKKKTEKIYKDSKTLEVTRKVKICNWLRKYLGIKLNPNRLGI